MKEQNNVGQDAMVTSSIEEFQRSADIFMEKRQWKKLIKLHDDDSWH